MAPINNEVLEAVELLSDFSEEFTRLLYRKTKMATVTKSEILKAVDILFEFSADERRHGGGCPQRIVNGSCVTARKNIFRTIRHPLFFSKKGNKLNEF